MKGEDSSGVLRLLQEQRRALEETDQQIAQLEEFISDYSALRTRLTTLPHAVKHDVMVPFGKLAFMPGQLVHTNELTVLLGDNWFAERSAKQAEDIAGRRITSLENQIKGLRDQRGLLAPRLDYTSQQLDEQQSEVCEIQEQYDSDTDRNWREQHRRNVRKHRAQQRTERTPVVDDKPEVDVWARLDELERQERRNHEMSSDKTSSQQDSEARWQQQVKTGNHGNAHHVSWHDQVPDESSSDSAPVSDGDSDSDGENLPRIINFSHTPTDACAGSTSGSCSGGGDGSVTSPGDIYKQFVQPHRVTKSILKSPSGDGTGGSYGTPGQPFTGSIQETQADRKPEAFSGLVQEKPQDVIAETKHPVKKVSLFKARQMRK